MLASHRRQLAAFIAAGQPPPSAELNQLARAHGGEPGPVRAELTAADVLAFTAAGQIRAAYPFSPMPTPAEPDLNGFSGCLKIFPK